MTDDQTIRHIHETKDARHSFIWGPALDAEFSKLNQWWFCKVTGEHVPDVDLWRATAQGFYKRPDDWPAGNHGSGSGGWKGQPKNERAIIFQVLLKASVELYIKGCKDGDCNYETALEDCIKNAERNLSDACKAAGVN